MAQLVVVDGPAMGRTYQIGPEATIGADPKNTVCLSDRRAGPFDARIEQRDGEFRIRALSATAALLVNGAQVQDSALQHGDMVTIGQTMLLFDHDERNRTKVRNAAQTTGGNRPT